MKKPKRKKLLTWEKEEPKYIILNKDEYVYTGLKQGYAQFSDDISQAKILDRQEIFHTMERFTQMKLEQMFI